MCSHSSSAQSITLQIENEVYPAIEQAFRDILSYYDTTKQSEIDFLLPDSLLPLKIEFESLRNYETKLVFPSVLKVFDTKDKPGVKPAINMVELQKLTSKKENQIAAFVLELKEERSLIPKEHHFRFAQLINLFENSFSASKKQWNQMLQSWSIGCACFVNAQLNDENIVPQ